MQEDRFQIYKSGSFYMREENNKRLETELLLVNKKRFLDKRECLVYF